MNHAGALRDRADVASLAAHREFNRDLLHAGVCCQNALGCVFAMLLVAGEAGNQRGETVHDRGDVKGLADQAGRGDADVLGFETELRGGDFSHPLSDLNAIGVAGIGVPAVHDNSLRAAILQVIARHEERSAFHAVLGVDRGCGAGHIAHDQSEIALRLILSDAAVNAVSPESERRADISGRDLQHVSDPSSKKGYAYDLPAACARKSGRLLEVRLKIKLLLAGARISDKPEAGLGRSADYKVETLDSGTRCSFSKVIVARGKKDAVFVTKNRHIHSVESREGKCGKESGLVRIFPVRDDGASVS